MYTYIFVFFFFFLLSSCICESKTAQKYRLSLCVSSGQHKGDMQQRFVETSFTPKYTMTLQDVQLRPVRVNSREVNDSYDSPLSHREYN